MDTAEERLEFAVRFAGLDLDSLRKGDWLNLQDDVRAFLEAKGNKLNDIGGIVTVPEATNEDYSEDALRKLKGDVFDILVVQAQPWARRDPPVPFTMPSKTKIPVTVEYQTTALKHGMIWVQGAVRDCFLTKLVILISLLGPDRVQSCPSCGKIIYKKGRKTYCSRKCANRANARILHKRKKAGGG